MKKKLRIGILFGGRSGEHEVSLLSAASVLKAIDRKRYDVVPIAIDKQGHWLCAADALRLLEQHRAFASDDEMKAATAIRMRRSITTPMVPPITSARA